MKNPEIKHAIPWPFLLMIFLLAQVPVSLTAQLSPRIEKAVDEYNRELLKVYQYAETESPSVAINRIDNMLPQLEKMAQSLVALVSSDAEALDVLDADDSYLLFQEKPYFKEMMRIMQSEEFNEKMEMHPELRTKIEEAESILESYDETGLSEESEGSGSGTESAYKMTIEGSDFEGTYEIVTHIDQNAVATIDDLGYLRFDILGDAGEEATVSFFVENKEKGKQDWVTDGQFMYEQLNEEGELVFSIWGSEGEGYFDITSLGGPGDFIIGTIHGTCQLSTDDLEEQVRISAEFRVRYRETEY